MNENTTLLPENFNYQAVPDCIKEIWNLTEREIVNICNGTSQVLSYGIWDYFAIFFVVALITLFSVAIVMMIKMLYAF